MRRATSPRLLSQAAQMLEDGASYKEASRTLGVSHRTLSRHLPGRSQWTDPSEAGRFGATMRRSGGAL
ncbi:helix-turn-helix domain-containing protein [Promicromonospora sp. NPDC050262]|uniref:helix-turn-helix domain-containing protein n=1 Tax=Promicromonospora sp. NPDC050262 TaxID=3155036 RepID=UPI00340B3E61